jgi:hypothetical protein
MAGKKTKSTENEKAAYSVIGTALANLLKGANALFFSKST